MDFQITPIFKVKFGYFYLIFLYNYKFNAYLHFVYEEYFVASTCFQNLYS